MVDIQIIDGYREDISIFDQQRQMKEEGQTFQICGRVRARVTLSHSKVYVLGRINYTFSCWIALSD